MRPAAKAGLVALGYVAALAITLLVAAIQRVDPSGLDQQGGMGAFGDSLMLLTVFGVAAIPATLAALFFPQALPRILADTLHRIPCRCFHQRYRRRDPWRVKRG